MSHTPETVEAAGIEPSCDSDATDNPPCGCENCHPPCAAPALHFWRPEWLELVSNDTDLQDVVRGWERMPPPIRKAIVALAGSVG
jgi:hypothetical protein